MSGAILHPKQLMTGLKMHHFPIGEFLNVTRPNHFQALTAAVHHRSNCCQQVHIYHQARQVTGTYRDVWKT